MVGNFGELVARMHQGDRDAIRLFVMAYGDPIRRAARRRLLQLGLEKSVEPDQILDATIVELCQTTEDVRRFELDQLWAAVDRAVQFEATAVWRHRNAACRQICNDRLANEPGLDSMASDVASGKGDVRYSHSKWQRPFFAILLIVNRIHRQFRRTLHRLMQLLSG